MWFHREKVLQQVFKIVFSVIANSSKERRLALFSSAKDIALDLFQPASRHKLVERINEIIDVPVLNESQEEKLLSVGIDYCASTLENLLPKQLVTSLRAENSTSMDEFKKFLVAEGAFCHVLSTVIILRCLTSFLFRLALFNSQQESQYLRLLRGARTEGDSCDC